MVQYFYDIFCPLGNLEYILKLNKLLTKHIKNENFVKVYTATEDADLGYYEGFIFEYNNDYVLMNDMRDFNYDGLVVFKKADIHEVKHTDNEKFFLHLLKKEGIKKNIYKKRKYLNFQLASMQEMMKSLKSLRVPIICEHLYGKKELFQIGIIKKVSKKKSKMKYFNARGEFDFKLVSVSYKSLTFIRIDSPYANIFYKYSK